MNKEEENKKIHFIGIAGAGMSALAAMLQKMGYEVTGSDEDFYEPILGYLKKNKIKILTPYSKKNIPEDADTIVIGKHAKLNPEENEEVREALKSKNKVKAFPEVLADITKDRENIVVAGSYGKSTCTALLAWCLQKNNIDAGYFIGGIPNGLEDSAHLGSEKYFVLEGDEYPAFMGVSKFLYLHPKHVILTSAEHDHINIFKTKESYVEPYKKLVALLPENGTLVAGINNLNVSEIIKNSKAKVVTYGMSCSEKWYGKNIKYSQETSFDLYNKQEKITTLSTTLLGKHNIENIIGVSAFLLEKKIINETELQKAVASFKGIKRRIDSKTEKSSVLVYEGFGSSYYKAKSVFDSLKLHFPDKKLITVFEPHTFGWRNAENKKWYKDIFDTSSQVLILPPGAHGSKTHNQMTFSEILKEVKKNKTEVYKAKNEKEALEILKKIVKKDDIVALISSGSLFGLSESVPKLMEKMFPK